MRLLDQVAQYRAPLVGSAPSGLIPGLPSISRLSSRIVECPLRYVLCDDTVALASQTVLHNPAVLAASLDLLRLPAERMWMEWNDAVHIEAVRRASGDPEPPLRSPAQIGMLIETDERGRAGVAWICWRAEDRIDLSPISIEFDFERPIAHASHKDPHLRRQFKVSDFEGLDPLFAHLIFALDPNIYLGTHLHVFKQGGFSEGAATHIEPS